MGTRERRPGIDVRGVILRPEAGAKEPGNWKMGKADVACLVATALMSWAAGCNGNTPTGFNDGDGGNGGTTATAPTQANVDSGIACGVQGACAAPQACCYAAATAPLAPAPAPTCIAQSACAGSSLSCSSTAQCSGSQVCCFVYEMPDAGQGDGGRAFPVIGAQTFSAQCADQCPTGDMMHYQLCAVASECPSGESCVRGTYTTYCAATRGGGGPGFPFPDGGGGLGFPFPDGGPTSD